MEQRRRRQTPTAAENYLRKLPSLALLDRLPTPMLGVESGGQLTYANPACAELFGYPDSEGFEGLDLPTLLCGHETLAPADCLPTLRCTTSAVDWNHAQGYVIRTMLSEPLLLRATDTLLLIGITDVTAWMWETEHGQSG